MTLRFSLDYGWNNDMMCNTSHIFVFIYAISYMNYEL